MVATRHAAGVGKIDRQSPIMNAKITEVNFNPFWTVPASIIRKDLIPKMQKEPNYLTENKIRIFNGGGRGAAARSRSTGTPTRRPATCSGRTPAATSTRWASCASTSRTRTASTCTTRPRRASSATISASSPRAACACRTCATTSSGSSRTRPAGAASRSTRPSRRASASTPARPAGQRLLDLHHRLGDRRRPRPVPRRHLQPRRPRQRDPGGEPHAGRPEPDAKMLLQLSPCSARLARADCFCAPSAVLDHRPRT